MTTMNISLPDSMRAFIEQKVVQGGYSTASEYIRQLVRDDQKQAAQQRLEQLLLEGLDSGPPIEISDEYWAAKKADLLKRVGEQRLKRPYILRPAADRDVDEHFLYLAKQKPQRRDPLSSRCRRHLRTTCGDARTWPTARVWR